MSCLVSFFSSENLFYDLSVALHTASCLSLSVSLQLSLFLPTQWVIELNVILHDVNCLYISIFNSYRICSLYVLTTLYRVSNYKYLTIRMSMPDK